MTSAAWAAIRTETVAIMTPVRSRDWFAMAIALAFCATFTTSVITRAWIVMLQTLTAAPKTN